MSETNENPSAAAVGCNRLLGRVMDWVIIVIIPPVILLNLVTLTLQNSQGRFPPLWFLVVCYLVYPPWAVLAVARAWQRLKRHNNL